ncbi:hypothetical protein EHE19_018035 [Ruminiclostridium herbifermentans]|uniref:Uncharacterized protein n=1 Tax=Ruminiclostridium herbifermentans TaxID=2488810 RepID=A0A7H1VMV3_9FIRM|nr:hypothetical protein [Ruminiclostridium herbifermentans]QNU66715.1 hypothetical protein EHE19_018035 [Ruminiclostridium herbifermentans]
MKQSRKLIAKQFKKMVKEATLLLSRIKEYEGNFTACNVIVDIMNTMYQV